MASSSETFTENSNSEVKVDLVNEKGEIIPMQNKCKFFVIQTKLFLHLAYAIRSL